MSNRYFIDTEFYEDGKTIDLISIGVVSSSPLITGECREFYAVNCEARLDRVSPWVREHVLPSLPSYSDPAWMTRNLMANKLENFIAEGLPKVEFWGYYADYDWVCLCQLFGTMMDLPKKFPKVCMDLKQLSIMKGNPKHPADPVNEHNALEDARWNKRLFEFLLPLPYRWGIE